MIDIKNAAGDTVSTTNLQAVKSFVGAGGGATDLTFTGASSPYTLASSTGTDVTISAGTNVTLTRTGNDLEIASSGGSGAVATDAIWDAKGDLAVGTGANTASRLAVGTDGKQIYADAAESTGLRWGASIISPSQITSDQDDYAPTGWAKAQIVRLDGDSGQRAITSFSATFDGDVKTLINVGSYPIYFPSEHPDGTAANRVAGHKDNFLPPKKAARIYYDNTSSRWRLIEDLPDWNYGRLFLYTYAPGSSTTGDWGNVTFNASGGGGATNSAVGDGLPGYNAVSTSSSATGASSVGMSKTLTGFSYYGDAHIYTEWTVSIDNLSDGSQTYECNVGLFTSSALTTLNSNNSVGIRYTHGKNSGKWQLFSRDNAGAETTADSGVTVAVTTLYVLRVEMNKARSEARYYIDGAYVGRITANMPTTTTYGSRACIVKSVGTTARLLKTYRASFGATYN